jgi:hypothetical protein
MRRVLLAVMFLFLSAIAARASDITVAQATISGWQDKEQSPQLRIFVNKPVVTSDGKVLQTGSPTTGVFYKSISCSVSGGMLTIPQLTIDSLTDALSGGDARYSAYFYRSTGNSQIIPYAGFTAFSVPAAPTSTTWASLLQFNSTSIPFIDTVTYSRTQIDAKIAAITAGGVFAPKDGTYLLNRPVSGLDSAQALSDLSTGLLKSTTVTGTVSIASAGVDYQAPISATAPLTFSSNTVGIPQANAATNGYLSAADWSTFNAKQAALGFTPENAANKNQVSGYAGLSGGKVAASQISEVLGISDLTDVSGALGTGTTVIKGTFAGIVSGQTPVWNGTDFVPGTPASVTSVGLSTDAGFLSVSGSPVTSSGTIGLNLTSGLSANQVVATPNGSTGTVGPRALVNPDLPVVDNAHGGTGLTTLGAAYTVLGVNSGATANQYLTLSAGSNITITPSGSTITISAAGAPNHTLLSATHTDSVAAGVVRGDLIVGQGTGTPTWQRKGLGAANLVVQSNGTDVVYGQVSLTAGVTGILPPANGGSGINASTAANGKLLIGNGAGFGLNNLTAGSNITITNSAGNIQIDASGTLGAAWSDLTSPAADLSLSMSTHTTTFTWGDTTGANDLLTLTDSSSNTGTGHILAVTSAASSSAKPVLITAGGPLNGVEMDTSGVLAPIGTGGITATLLSGSGNGIQAQTASGTFAGRTITASAGVSISNGDGVADNPTISANLASLVASQTIWDGSQASRTLTADLSGTDPVLTFSNNSVDVSTGVLKQGGVNVVLESRTLTGGTGINAIGDLSTNRTVSVDPSFSPTWTGIHTFTPAARSSGSASYISIAIPADTQITASTESIGFKTVTATRTWATGALTTQRENVFAAPTYAFAGTSTLTNAATLAVTGAPIAGSNATITNPYALWIQGGLAQFDGGAKATTFNATSGFQLSGTALAASHLSNGVTGSGSVVLASSPTITTPTISGAISFPDGVRQTFNPDATTPGLNLGAQAGDPSTPSNGDVWYNSSTNKFRARQNGASVDVIAGGLTTSYVSIPGASCNGTSAVSNFDLPTTGAASASCTGTTTVVGTTDFPDGSITTGTVQFRLPPDWNSSGSLSVTLTWLANVSTTDSARFQVGTGCRADGEAVDTGPTYNTASVNNFAYTGTANQRQTSTFSPVSTTNCAAGETMWVYIQRQADAGHTSDTLSATVRLLEAQISLARTP